MKKIKTLTFFRDFYSDWKVASIFLKRAPDGIKSPSQKKPEQAKKNIVNPEAKDKVTGQTHNKLKKLSSFAKEENPDDNYPSMPPPVSAV